MNNYFQKYESKYFKEEERVTGIETTATSVTKAAK
jgi:hypothetical protein